WFKVELTAENKNMFYLPKGFAHGFLALEDDTEFQYKCTDYYAPEYDSGILWNDKDIGIDWEFEKYGLNKSEIILSEKDKIQQTLKEFIEKGIRL
ncbi:MAG: dTDP-4-dehydrorhamnose 3,5-epimerase, partial [Fusobacteriaceae bacterium]|nr:dTDP-4-dehydrorhamnose 3,5-epimerase [Fusobacteriaceae bacterium]